jgi:hypothetical protein
VSNCVYYCDTSCLPELVPLLEQGLEVVEQIPGLLKSIAMGQVGVILIGVVSVYMQYNCVYYYDT